MGDGVGESLIVHTFARGLIVLQDDVALTAEKLHLRKHCLQ